jgi:hypothetical protein
MKTVIFAQAKGGSGKTTTTVFLAQTLALQGFKVHVFDFDFAQRGAYDWLRKAPHENLSVSDKADPVSGFNADIRIIDTEGKSELKELAAMLNKLPPADLLIIPSSASSLDLRQLAYTCRGVSQTCPKAECAILWSRLNLRTTEAQPDILSNYANLANVAPFDTLIPYTKDFASMNKPYATLTPARRAVWENLAKEVAAKIRLEKSTVKRVKALASA